MTHTNYCGEKIHEHQNEVREEMIQNISITGEEFSTLLWAIAGQLISVLTNISLCINKHIQRKIYRYNSLPVLVQTKAINFSCKIKGICLEIKI